MALWCHVMWILPAPYQIHTWENSLQCRIIVWKKNPHDKRHQSENKRILTNIWCFLSFSTLLGRLNPLFEKSPKFSAPGLLCSPLLLPLILSCWFVTMVLMKRWKAWIWSSLPSHDIDKGETTPVFHVEANSHPSTA